MVEVKDTEPPQLDHLETGGETRDTAAQPGEQTSSEEEEAASQQDISHLRLVLKGMSEINGSKNNSWRFLQCSLFSVFSVTES